MENIRELFGVVALVSFFVAYLPTVWYVDKKEVFKPIPMNIDLQPAAFMTSMVGFGAVMLVAVVFTAMLVFSGLAKHWWGITSF